MNELHQAHAQNTVIGTGWFATMMSLFAVISPESVKEWAAVAQMLAIGGFTLYLTLRKQYESANRESLLEQVENMKAALEEAAAERAALKAQIEAKPSQPKA